MTDPIELLQQIVQIYSPSGKEQTLAKFLHDYLLRTGFKRVRLDSAGNVLGEVGSGHPRILLCGHMDTVPGRLPVKIKNNKLFGRGTVDAKSSLAAMVAAASQWNYQQTTGTVIVVGVVDEEGKGRGIRHITKQDLDVDYAIFGEPSGVKNITRGYKGKIKAKILFQTKAAHSSAPHLFDNAIEKAYEFWSDLKNQASESERPHRSIYYSTTICLTKLCGGGPFGSIPATCEEEIEIRVPPSSSCQQNLDWLNSNVYEFLSKNPEIQLQVKIEDVVEPFIARKDSMLIKMLTEAIKDTTGGPVRLLRKTGTGDMNVFAEHVKIPVVTYGPGDSHLSHTREENVEIKEFLTCIEVYRKTLEKLVSSER